MNDARITSTNDNDLLLFVKFVNITFSLTLPVIQYLSPCLPPDIELEDSPLLWLLYSYYIANQLNRGTLLIVRKKFHKSNCTKSAMNRKIQRTP